jgi:hypothetical protein
MALVSHTNQYIFIQRNFTTSGVKAVDEKQWFKQIAAAHGVTIKLFRADNGIIACQEYVNNKQQPSKQ